MCGHAFISHFLSGSNKKNQAIGKMEISRNIAVLVKEAYAYIPLSQDRHSIFSASLVLPLVGPLSSKTNPWCAFPSSHSSLKLIERDQI